MRLPCSQGKYGLIHRGQKETFSEKNNYNQISEMASDEQKMKSDDHHDDKAEKQVRNYDFDVSVFRLGVGEMVS